MSDKLWISIDPLMFRQPVKQQMGTATVTTSTSPYSVPQAATAWDDKSAGTYVFECKYIGGDEPVEAYRLPNVQVLRGKNSKRLFKVLLNHTPELADRDHVFVAFKNAINGANTAWHIDNFSVVNNVIDVNKNLFVIPGLDPEAETK